MGSDLKEPLMMQSNSVLKLLSRKASGQWIFEGDIRGCFDNINHEWLIDNIPMDKKILLQWLKAGYIHKRILYPTEAGTPQGGVCSATLANMTLDGLELELKSSISKTRFIWSGMRMTYHYRKLQGVAGK